MEKLAWLLTVLFFAFKIAGVADISWLFVLAPVLINYGIAILLLVVVLFLNAINRSRY